MKKNNKGFSLIELLIVIAVIAVVTSASTVTFQMIYNAKVSTAARKVQSYCKTVRLNNMTKAQLKYIHIFRDGSGEYYINIDENKSTDTSKKDEAIGNPSLAIKYVTASSSSVANNITIFFDRNGQCEILKGASRIDDVIQLRFTNGSRISNVNISKVTGKVTM